MSRCKSSAALAKRSKRARASAAGAGRNSHRLRAFSTVHGPLHLETLEARCMLAAVSWIGGVDNSWETASNWSSGIVPGNNDDVPIDIPRDNVVIQVAATESVNSLQCDESLVVASGGLSVSAS